MWVDIIFVSSTEPPGELAFAPGGSLVQAASFPGSAFARFRRRSAAPDELPSGASRCSFRCAAGAAFVNTGQVALWDGVQWTDGTSRLRHEVTRRPKRSDPRQRFYRWLTWKLWFPLMEWAMQVGLGQRIQESVHDPISPPRDAVARLLAPTIEASSVRDGLWGGIEDIRIRTLVEVLDNHSTSERERVRMDFLAFSRAGELHNLVGFILSRMWKMHFLRALFVPGLILLRRSPDHQDDLAMALGLPAKS